MGHKGGHLMADLHIKRLPTSAAYNLLATAFSANCFVFGALRHNKGKSGNQKTNNEQNNFGKMDRHDTFDTRESTKNFINVPYP